MLIEHPLMSPTSPSLPSLSIATFHTNLTHPAEPHHEVVVKSAILHLGINQKSPLGQRKTPLNVTLYWLQDAHPSSDAARGKNVNSGNFLKSFTIDSHKDQALSFDVGHLLAENIPDFEHDHRPVMVGVSVQQQDPHLNNDYIQKYTDDQIKRNAKSRVSRRRKVLPPMSRRSREMFEKLYGKDNVGNRYLSNRLIPLKNLYRSFTDQDQELPENNPTSSAGSQFNFRIKTSLEITSQKRDIRSLSRKRRGARSKKVCSNSMCCRHRIRINFSDIGWDDWVVAPAAYDAYYCKGACSLRYKSASTFSQIKSLLNAQNPDLIPAPVCAATGYHSLPLLYYDDDGMLQDMDYPDMVVQGCRCR